MRSPAPRLALLLTACLTLASACSNQGDQPPSRGGADATPRPAAADLTGLIQAHIAGLGHMERFEYRQAVAAFRRAVALAPTSESARVNLAIALLNDSGVRSEEEKKANPATASRSNFDEALKILDGVLAENPANLHARYSRGVILQYVGEIQRAHEDFADVIQRDPTDAHAWLRFGMTLSDPDRPHYPAGPDQADQLIEIYRNAVTHNPYLATAWFKLQEAYNMAAARARGARDAEAVKRLAAESEQLRSLWRRLDPNQNPASSGEASENFYGDMGKYATIVSTLPGLHHGRAPEIDRPRFDPPRPLSVTLARGERWAQRKDFSGDLEWLGRVRDRFGAAAAHLDADGDGKLDLFLAAAVKTPKTVRDALLLNRGDGRFEEASADFGLSDHRASVGVAAGDFDADGHIDLFLTGLGDHRLLRNQDGKRFEDLTDSLGLTGPKTLSLGARWLDLDQDGDLDLYLVNYTDLEHAADAFRGDAIPPGVPNLAFRNDGKPAPLASPEANWAPKAVDFSGSAQSGLSVAWGHFEPDQAAALQGGDAPHTGLAALDLDGDRDLDLVLAADGQAPTAVLNDRLGRFHSVALPDLDPRGRLNGLLVLDLDKDARSDLVAILPDRRLLAWRNATGLDRSQPADSGPVGPGQAAKTPVPPASSGAIPERPPIAFEFWPIDARAWNAAQVADLDLDGWTDLLGQPVPVLGDGDVPNPNAMLGDVTVPRWARNEGNRIASMPLAIGPDATSALLGLDLADLLGDPLPDLLILRDGAGPRVARHLGNGNHWLALAFSGRWKYGKGPDGGPMRSNPQGLGTRVEIQGTRLDVPFAYTTLHSGLAQSAGPVVVGLGDANQAMLVRLTWPDGVMQSELNVGADQVLKLAEFNRKTGSCPVLFTFDGRRFVCIGDFLGGGGLGYLVAPDLYGQPDRDEAVAIAPDQLREVDGVYHLAITEPMDELAYLDHLNLEVVDRPAGLESSPDERFAPGGHRPTGRLLAWRRTIEPVKATDLSGRDMTATLHAWDRRTVDTFRKLPHWTGYAEEHGIVLDFADRLAAFGPDDRLVLALAGWVEYPYSQTNYAASTAGVPLQPPVLERLRDDGTWELLEPDPGYPAGLPRLTTLELTGKLNGPRCVLRLRTNMECYYDQAFLAVIEPDPALRTTTLPVTRADLHYRGYTREFSPDGRPPLLYDYDHIDPAPLARLSGRLTRFGDVAPLLQADDDQLCLIGPGDEVTLTFDAASLPPLPDGWTRAFVLRAIGYCKDADPFTAASDTVGPLPWKGMPAYPFGPEGERPRDPAYEEYLRTYQTREVGR